MNPDAGAPLLTGEHRMEQVASASVGGCRSSGDSTRAHGNDRSERDQHANHVTGSATRPAWQRDRSEGCLAVLALAAGIRNATLSWEVFTRERSGCACGKAEAARDSEFAPLVIEVPPSCRISREHSETKVPFRDRVAHLSPASLDRVGPTRKVNAARSRYGHGVTDADRDIACRH